MNQEGIRCGFFNSVNNDRKYNAEDMGRLFEGVISDGIFSTIEPKFKVEAVPETMDLLVNNGKAWFHERYFEIYDPVTVSIRPTDINPRIDAICICINTNDSVRAGSIEVVEGRTSKPSMPVEDGVYYIPIAWITIGPNDTVSTDLDIESNVGNATDPVESYRCPYSEPSLDPRRAVYAYEGESEIDPTINEIVTIEKSEQVGHYHKIIFYYPTGFTYDNTMIIQMLFSEDPELYGWRFYSDTSFALLTDRIEISLSDLIPLQSSIYYKISLMKLEEESQNE